MILMVLREKTFSGVPLALKLVDFDTILSSFDFFGWFLNRINYRGIDKVISRRLRSPMGHFRSDNKATTTTDMIALVVSCVVGSRTDVEFAI